MSEVFIWIVSLSLVLYSGFMLLQRSNEKEVSSSEEDDLQVQELQLAYERATAYKGLKGLLKRLNIQLNPVLVMLGGGICSLSVSLVFLLLFPEKLLLAGVVGLAFLPLSIMVLQDIIARKTKRFERALIDVVDLMHSATAGGTSPLAALKIASHASRGFVRDAIEDIIQRLQMGASIESAATPLSRRYPSEGVQLFVKTLISRWHSGGDFEGLLAALGRILRERNAFRRQLRAQLSGARYALIFAGFFPYILIPFFIWKEPEWLTPLTSHAMGPTFMFVAVVCQLFGFLMMRRILRSDI